MKQIVIMPGGFHPFHAGHASLYQSALKAFPNADVYVAATNDTKTRPFPFAIKEKLAKLAGVAPGRFIQVKSPFKSEEITSHYNPNEDVLIFVRSEKDKTEQPKPGGTKKDGTPAYFQPWTGKNLQPFGKHAYIAYLPTVEFGPGIKSATEIRNAWPKLDDRRKTAMVMSLYPATQKNPKLAANVVKMLDIGMGEQLNEFAPDGFNGGDDSDGFDPYMAKQAEEDGFTKGVSLADGATTERAMTIQYWHTRDGGLYKQYFAKGFKQGRMNKIRHANKQYDLNLQLMKDGSIRHSEQGVAEGWKEKAAAAALAGTMATGASGIVLNTNRIIDGSGRSAANPYGNVTSTGHPIKKPVAKPEDDAWAKIEKRKAQEKLKEFAPGNGDDGLPHAEYVVYQCDPSDQFEFLGRPLYQTDSLGMAHKYAYEMYVKHRPKAFVIYQPHSEASRGNYGVKGESDGTEEIDEDSVELDPELQRVLLKAKQHYPNQPDLQHAFIKYVQRALRHSEEDDKRQDREIEALDKEVDQLQKKSNVAENSDYLEEK